MSFQTSWLSVAQTCVPHWDIRPANMPVSTFLHFIHSCPEAASPLQYWARNTAPLLFRMLPTVAYTARSVYLLDHAVYATVGSILNKSGAVFLAQYWSGDEIGRPHV